MNKTRKHKKEKEKEKIITLVSYAPSINKRLVSLKTIRKRDVIEDCNKKRAFQLKEPIQIKIADKCLPYNTEEAQEYLLGKLKENKHVQVKKIIAPVQSLGNCWFNTMFMAFFVSDKGRKFFHFFRQLMIQGKQVDGARIPKDMWTAFSLLNFAIESSLTGSKYAYSMNTNNIIKQIYLSVPDEYKKSYVVDVDIASNPLNYYRCITEYLQLDSLKSLTFPLYSDNWLQTLEQKFVQTNVPPHYIVLEVYDSSSEDETPGAGYSGSVTTRLKKFTIGKYEYVLDSCIIRDMEQQHFIALITCEGKEYGYDGASFSRLVPFKWKDKLNSHAKWTFKGIYDKKYGSLYWSFRHGYQMLYYYRTK